MDVPLNEGYFLAAIQTLIIARQLRVQNVVQYFQNLIKKRRAIARKNIRDGVLRVPRIIGEVFRNCPVGLRIRNLKSKLRSNRWWVMAENVFDDDEWIENFRMSRQTFDFVVNKVKHHQGYISVSQRKGTVSPRKRVAIAIFKLASCSEYRVVGNLFGVHKSTVCVSIRLFCQAVNELLLPTYIKMPSLEEAIDISLKFEESCGIPQIIGAIDGSHIPMTPPAEGLRDFTNRKGWPSLVLQAVVDNNYLFRDISCIKPGSSHDAFVLKESGLFKSNRTLIPSAKRTINNTEVDLHLVGDPAYPILPWLMVAHRQPCNRIQESFNVYLSSARVVVECAFGRLKGRFRCLSRKSDFHYSFVPSVVATCVVLHNIIELAKEKFPQTWQEQMKTNDKKYPQPISQAKELDSMEGSLIRDALTEYMFQNFELRTSTLN